MDERDSFWDIEKLVPKSKKTATPFVTKNIVSDYRIEGKSLNDSDERKLNFEEFKGVSSIGDTRYVLENSLIKCVTVTSVIEKYDFYANFKKAALIHYDMHGSKCEFEKFFSYMPQYSQLTPRQRSYYLYWRSEFCKGNYIKTDYSYLYLYAYEIINLPEKIPPIEGVNRLAELWRAYRQDLPNIDKFLSLWVEDYCLVHKLSLPINIIGNFVHEAMKESELSELYIPSGDFLTKEAAEALITELSYYDWRRVKFAGGDNREIYKKHLMGAMRLLFVELWKNGSFFNENSQTAIITRHSFRGALRTQCVKNTIKIEYYPVAKDEGLRFTVTEALRYTENQLRALLGIKSRLAIKGLNTEYKKIIDFYFSGLFEKAKKIEKEASKPEYEKLYDSLDNELSSIGADEIESLSWINTKMLVPEEEISCDVENGSEAFSKSVNLREEPQCSSELEREDAKELCTDDIEFIKALLSSNSDAVKAICDKIGELAESVSERINEASLNYIGDVIIEFTGDEPSIIEDYREDILEWIEKITS